MDQLELELVVDDRYVDLAFVLERPVELEGAVAVEEEPELMGHLVVVEDEIGLRPCLTRIYTSQDIIGE